MVKWEENYKLIFNQVIDHLMNPLIELFYYLNNSESKIINGFLDRFKVYLQLVFFPTDQLNGYRHAIELESDNNEQSYHAKLFEKLETNINSKSDSDDSEEDASIILKLGSIQSLPIWLELFCKDTTESEKDHIKALKVPLAFKLIKLTYPYLKVNELFSDYKASVEMPRKKVKKSSSESLALIQSQLECINLSIEATSNIIKILKDLNLFTNTLGVTQLVDREALLNEYIELITIIEQSSSSQLFNLPTKDQLSICLNNCLICYSNLINLNPSLFDSKLTKMWDLSLITKYPGALDLALSLINNYSRIRKLDLCTQSLVESITSQKLVQSDSLSILFNPKFISNLYTVLNESTNIHQLDAILEPITAELLNRLGESKSDTGLPHQLHIVSQLTHIWSTIVSSLDKGEVKEHLKGHFDRFIEKVFIPNFKWSEDKLKDDDHCKSKLKKISKLFDEDDNNTQSDINFINSLQLLSLTLTTTNLNSWPSSTSPITFRHLYNLIKEMSKKINLNNKLGKLIVLKVIIQFGDLIILEGQKDSVLVELFNFCLSQVELTKKSDELGNGEGEGQILLSNLDTNYNEAIWHQLSNKASWNTIYSGLLIGSSNSSNSEVVGGIIDNLAKSILNRQLIFSNGNDSAFTEYQLEGDKLSYYWLHYWLKLTQEGLVYFRENFIQTVLNNQASEASYKHEKLSWLNLDTLDLTKIGELEANIKGIKSNSKLFKDQVKFFELMFSNLKKLPSNLIPDGLKVKLINLIHIILVFIKLNYAAISNDDSDGELVEFVNLIISTLNPIQNSLSKAQASKLIKFEGFNNLLNCTLPILSKIKDFTKWYELRQKLTSTFIHTFGIFVSTQALVNDETLINLVLPNQHGSDSEGVAYDSLKLDLMSNILLNLNANFNSSLIKSELISKVPVKLILNYYNNNLMSEIDLTQYEKTINSQLAGINDILSNYEEVFEFDGAESDVKAMETKLPLLTRDILKVVEFLEKVIYSQYSLKSLRMYSGLSKLRDSTGLNQLITQLIQSLVNFTSYPLLSQLLFQSVLNLIQCKLVLFSLNTKLVPSSELNQLVNWIQLIYHYANPHIINTKLIEQMSTIGANLSRLMNHEQLEQSVSSILQKIGYRFKLDELLSTLQLLNDWLLDDPSNKKGLKVRAITSTINHLVLSNLTCMDSVNRESLTLPSLEFIYNSLGVAKYQLDQTIINSVLQLIQQLLKQESKVEELHKITKLLIRIIKFHFKLIQLTNLQVILVELVQNWIILFNLNGWTRVDLIISPILTSLPTKCYTEDLTKSYNLVISNVLTELIHQRLEFSQVFTNRTAQNTPEGLFEESYINKNLTSEFEGWFNIFLILETCSNQLSGGGKRDEDFSLKKVLSWISPHGQNLLKLVRAQYVSSVKFKGKV
ncbi:hypothetical protein CONCODRAFT_78158 [Conidiobolus coronatus NRRL 28638]|uniref:Uncharacterized protein n=1 Tax=Conidiobolus coronatus (strain ATCC 28846 / CBS 209.66 / NRRL 28638) TaxID=796925 RepID=A0A137P9X1_CONC2|nr:hypothetical protein CONCODRAFT_78158 [Conidiobolus coronatus NRRL 28638]|eukprot:KXN71793.1 hypothetical protein CONCODRAFT_78158 [Conidiobolus coronatus NRRL 28638]